MTAPSSPTSPGPPPHPEELLAGFVDGTASAGERAQVQRHLALCERCRVEVELAARARAALAALPQLDPPGLADRGLEALRERARAQGPPLPEPPAAPAPPPVALRPPLLTRRARPPRTGRRPLRSARLAWGAGLAAAAALLVLAVRLGALTPPPPPGPGGPAAPAQPTLPASYDRAALRALADTLASAELPSPTAQAPLAQQAEEATAEARQPPPLSPAPAQGLECARRAVGLGPEAVPIYLEEASFEGTPAYVAAFPQQSETRQQLLVVAVARGACRELARVQREL